MNRARARLADSSYENQLYEVARVRGQLLTAALVAFDEGDSQAFWRAARIADKLVRPLLPLQLAVHLGETGQAPWEKIADDLNHENDATMHVPQRLWITNSAIRKE